jgi:integrase
MPRSRPVKVEFTDRFLRSLKWDPVRGYQPIWDGALPNFGVRVGKTGKRTFIVARRASGNKVPRWPTVGIYPDMSLKEARERAREIRSNLMRGITPKQQQLEQQRREEERRAAEEARRQNLFATVAEDFIKKHLCHLRAGKRVEDLIRSTLIPRLGSRPAPEIRRSEICQLLEIIGEARGPAAARSTKVAISTIFDWTLNRGTVEQLEFNPATGIDMDKLVGPLRSRDRILTDTEIKIFWQATGQLDYPWQPLLRLLLATGQRLREIAHCQWQEVDVDKAELVLPAIRVKNKTTHIVPLAPMALKILRGLPRFAGGSYCFTTTAGRRPVGGFDRVKLRLDRLITDIADIPPWVIHDLRRTARSNFSALGVPPIVAEVCLGHKQGGVRGIYDRYSYAIEKRAALEKWEARLLSIVST